jgi:hypothetical protein
LQEAQSSPAQFKISDSTSVGPQRALPSMASKSKLAPKSPLALDCLNWRLLNLKVKLVGASQQNSKHEPEKNDKRETAESRDGMLNRACSVLDAQSQYLEQTVESCNERHAVDSGALALAREVCEIRQ